MSHWTTTVAAYGAIISTLLLILKILEFTRQRRTRLFVSTYAQTPFDALNVEVVKFGERPVTLRRLIVRYGGQELMALFAELGDPPTRMNRQSGPSSTLLCTPRVVGLASGEAAPYARIRGAERNSGETSNDSRMGRSRRSRRRL